MKHVPMIIFLYALPNQHELYKNALNVKVPTKVWEFLIS